MLSIAEYVESRGVSQTAVRRQLKRYSEELDGHIHQGNRRKMLDDFAVDFLDSHRMTKEIIVERTDYQAKIEIDDLKAEIEHKKDEISKLKDEVIFLQKQYMELKEQQTELLGYKAKNEILLEDAATRESRVKELETENRDLQDDNSSKESQIQELEKEIGSFKKSWFGFYRRKPK